MTEIDIKQRILAANESAAQGLRSRWGRTLVVNLISSPGSGKTTLLESTIERLRDEYRLGAIDGDIATERDANRLRRHGIPAHQVLTGGACHLDARQVAQALEQTPMDVDILFIENVGNLICPTSYDLGEDFKVVLLSVTEGDDKPFKYPAIFAKAEATLITKMDLLQHVNFKLADVRRQVATLRPDGLLLETSATEGEGLADWCQLLRERLDAKRGAKA